VNQKGIEVFWLCGDSDEDEIALSFASRFGKTMEYAPRPCKLGFNGRGMHDGKHAFRLLGLL